MISLGELLRLDSRRDQAFSPTPSAPSVETNSRTPRIHQEPLGRRSGMDPRHYDRIRHCLYRLRRHRVGDGIL